MPQRGDRGVTPHWVDLLAPRLRLLCPSAPLSVRDACAFTMIWGSGEPKLMVPLSPCHVVAVLPPSVAGGQRACGSSPVQRTLGFLPLPAADAGLLLAGCLSADDAVVLLPGVLSPSVAKPGVTRPAPAQGPSSVRISGLLSAPFLPLNCRPSPELCSIHTFGLEDVPKWLGVACPYHGHPQEPVSPPRSPGATCPPSEGAAPWGPNPSVTGFHQHGGIG